jgi:hypothetical protein
MSELDHGGVTDRAMEALATELDMVMRLRGMGAILPNGTLREGCVATTAAARVGLGNPDGRPVTAEDIRELVLGVNAAVEGYCAHAKGREAKRAQGRPKLDAGRGGR